MNNTKRHMFNLTTILITFVLASVSIQPSRSFGQSQAGAQSEVPADSPKDCLPPASVESGTCKVTIFFHGLMVGRYRKGRTLPLPREPRFEVGVVTDAPGHTFEICKWSDDGARSQEKLSNHGVYEFDIVDNDNEPVGLKVYLNNEQKKNFDRTRKSSAENAKESQDYRYIPDFEEFDLYEQKQDRWDKPFGFIFHVKKGVVSSKCITAAPLEKAKSGATWKPYGYIAEVVEVYVTLKEGQDFILKKKGADQPIFRIPYSSKNSIEVIIRNLPASHDKSHQDSNGKCLDEKQSKDIGSHKDTHGYLCYACEQTKETDPPLISHFQYYQFYVFKIEPGKRFDLRQAKTEKDNMLKGRSTIFPYKCGMVFQSKSGDDLEQDDIIPTPIVQNLRR